MRRLGDEHALVEHLQGPRQDEAVDEDGLLVHLAVAVRVFEHADAAGRLALVRGGQVLHVSDQLDDPHAVPSDPSR